MQLREAIQQNPHLGQLDSASIDHLADAMTTSSHEDGHVFIEEGTAGDTLYLLLQGTVRVSRAGEPLDRLGGGAFFGLLSLVDAEPRAATCRADGSDRCRPLA